MIKKKISAFILALFAVTSLSGAIAFSEEKNEDKYNKNNESTYCNHIKPATGSFSEDEIKEDCIYFLGYGIPGFEYYFDFNFDFGTSTPQRPDRNATSTPKRPDKDGTSTSKRPDKDGTCTPKRPDKDGTSTPKRPDKDGTSTSKRPDKDGTCTPIRHKGTSTPENDKDFESWLEKHHKGTDTPECDKGFDFEDWFEGYHKDFDFEDWFEGYDKGTDTPRDNKDLNSKNEDSESFEHGKDKNHKATLTPEKNNEKTTNSKNETSVTKNDESLLDKETENSEDVKVNNVNSNNQNPQVGEIKSAEESVSSSTADNNLLKCALLGTFFAGLSLTLLKKKQK